MASRLRCSVGEKCSEECFLKHFVKEDFSLHNPLDCVNLSDDLLRTFRYRVNIDSIKTICNHHIAAYTNCFKNHANRSKFCSDPFKVHTPDNRPAGNKSVSLQLCDSIFF